MATVNIVNDKGDFEQIWAAVTMILDLRVVTDLNPTNEINVIATNQAINGVETHDIVQ